MTRKIDLTGRRSGRLVVVGDAPTRRTPGGQTRSYWACLCDCGARSEVDGQAIREGRVKSCGCLNIASLRARAMDFTGRRFGRLIALRQTAATPTSWVCGCDCGTEKVVSTVLLARGDALSCGCLQALMSAHRRWTGEAVSYFGMHDRLVTMRGPAKEHACVGCGQRARDWSYDGGDPAEKFERIDKSLLAFSTNPDRYSPRCSKCHRRYDVALRKESA